MKINIINNFNFSYFLNKNVLINEFYKKNILFLKVLQIKKKYVIFDGNLKLECSLKIKEFLKNNFLEIKENDYVEIFLKNIENNFNKIIISRLKLKNYIFWKKISLFYKKKIFVKGNIINRVKGGYSIMIWIFKCFLPFSCSDKKICNVDYYLNKKLFFYILNLDILKKNIILSRKYIIFKVIKLKKKIFFNKAKPGMLIKGIIRNMTNYCVFVDTGYLDCIIFFKNLFWGNYRYFIDFLKVGKSILGVILKIDKKKKRVFLGIKQLFNFWKNILLFKNSIKYVRILRITTNKIYVILLKNFISSIYNKFNNKKINRFLKVNNYKKIKIQNFNFKKKRINFKFIFRP